MANVKPPEQLGKLDMGKQELAKPLNRDLMANDVAAMRMLVNDMNKVQNNPDLSADDKALVTEMIVGAGSAIPPGADAGMPQTNAPFVATPVQTGAGAGAQSIQQQSEPTTLEIVGPAPTQSESANPQIVGLSAPVSVRRIILTGRSGVGKNYLAQQAGLPVLELDTPCYDLLRGRFPNASNADLAGPASTLYWYGEGLITKEFPVTIQRLLFISICDKWRHAGNIEFGNPGYWVNHLVTSIEPDQSVVVTGVTTTSDFKALLAQGFVHYHIMCSTKTMAQRPRNPRADDRLAAAMDNDVIRKVSQQPRGDRLHAVWNDTTTAPGSRFYSVQDFLNAVKL